MECPQFIESYRLSNGLLVVFEPMPDVQSAALSLLLPAGGVRDPAGRCGTAAILSEMFPRGLMDCLHEACALLSIISDCSAAFRRAVHTSHSQQPQLQTG